MSAPEQTTDPRVALALSVLQHRTFCPDCAKHVDQIILALRGATLDEIVRLTR
jgi:hypothetical protein